MDRNRNLFWKLLEPEHVRATAFCRKLAGNREIGDDLYQDALVTALTKFESLRNQTSFRPWLYRILINTFRNSTRSPWWKRSVPLTEELSESVSGDDPIYAHTAKRWLRRAFKAVNEDERALVTLFELEGWTIAELAELQSKSESAIKVRLFRARRKMREEILRHLATTDTESRTDSKSAMIYDLSEERICVVPRPGTD